MTTVTTRTGKGSALTYAEMDANFGILETRWQNLPGAMVTDGISNAPPMRLFNSTMYMRAFSADTEQEVSAVFHMPKDFQAGTDTYPHGHIVTPTASSGVVRWKITVSYANEGATFSAPFTFYVNQTVDPADQNIHLLIDSGMPMTIPTLAPDSVILMRIVRDSTAPEDTYPDEIYLSLVDLYYQSQGFGEDHR